jgi:general secretion pathway protein D
LESVLGDIPLLGRLFRSTKDTHIKRNLMVFLRPTVVRDRAGMATLSGKKYRDISVLGADEEGNSTLPGNAERLFDKPGAAAIDLRQKE